jgi:hypothetical protein
MAMVNRRRVFRALALVLLFAWGWGAGSALAADEIGIGRVAEKSGFVTLTRDDRTRVVPVGAPVSAGDRVVTAADGRVEIAFRDGTVLVIGPASEVIIADYQVDGGGHRLRALLSLLGGILRSTVAEAPEGGKFDVETRVAVASVRSTEWVIEAENREHTAVFVVDGVVEVVSKSENTGVRVEAGYGTDVFAGKAPTPPKQWGKKRVDAVLARTRMP